MVLRILSIVLLISITDVLLYQVFIRVFANIFLRRTLRWFHLGIISAFILFSIIILIITGDPGEDYKLYRNYFLWMDVFLLIYLSKIVLLFTLSPLLLFKFGRRPGRISPTNHYSYLRNKYLWIATSFFITLLSLFISFDGIIRGPSRFQVRKVDLSFKNLPAGFEHFTIVQFSDIHLGSWFHKENVIKGLQLIQGLNANAIVFTGDLINVNANETIGYENSFKSLSALAGKYAILGNHDVGDFTRLGRGRNLLEQIPALTKFYNDQQFKLLRNEHVVIHKNNDSIVIAGVDNWSANNFKRYGDLNKALKGLNNHPFTVLLTHDPSHWEAEVLGKSTVDLTLSGHTHGGQLGIRAFGLVWSPIQLVYKHWDGLYEKFGRYLYVSPGMGFVGYSGRIGIMPEITLFRLHKI